MTDWDAMWAKPFDDGAHYATKHLVEEAARLEPEPIAAESFLDDKVTLHCGDMLAVLPTLAENSIDSCVTDPPYHLTSIVQRFGADDAAPLKEYAKYAHKGANPYKRVSTGFMGKKWDGGDVAFKPETWREVWRVLKPGAHLLAFGGTRTYHRMACAIEDAGFEIRDCIMWVYGSGFPKSLDVSKAIDKAAGAEREVVGKDTKARSTSGKSALPTVGGETVYETWDITAPATPAAREWAGWGTALKPSAEPVVVAQKPLNDGHYVNTIGSTLIQLWSRIWLMLSARDAAKFSALSPAVYGADPHASARWIAGNASNIREDLCDQMGTSQFESALILSLNTASSWVGTWAALSQPENTSIIATELNTTIDLRTLSCLVSRITPEDIILAHKSGRWLNADASNAARAFNAAVLRCETTLELSALESAIGAEATDCRAEGVNFSPALEPIVVARKPLSEPTVAANVLRWGTGALNVDGCRIATNENRVRNNKARLEGTSYVVQREDKFIDPGGDGRWPANIVHDGSDEVVGKFPDTGKSPPIGSMGGGSNKHSIYGDFAGERHENGFGDSGSAARFFYTAKADADDRLGSKHPTVKPVDLMQWLVRLVTPKGGLVLDPFSGTGTTGEAAWREGMRAVLIEREAEYQGCIRRRMALALAGPDERTRETIRAAGRDQGHDDLPLFGGKNG